MSAKPPNAKAATAPRPSSLPREDGGPAPIPSATLLQGRDAITIEHNGRLYQLRKTRQGKLILTK